MLDQADRIARAEGRASIRTDIHPENDAMDGLLRKHGYARCGMVEVRDALGRVKRRAAYERLL